MGQLQKAWDLLGIQLMKSASSARLTDDTSLQSGLLKARQATRTNMASTDSSDGAGEQDLSHEPASTRVEALLRAHPSLVHEIF
jgi:hypothetical protein